MAFTMPLNTAKRAAAAPFCSRRPSRSLACHAHAERDTDKPMAAVALAAAASLLLSATPALATPRLTYDEIQSLSYKQVKGSGIANTCPVVIPANVDATLKDLGAGSYRMSNFCMEPTQFQVREEPNPAAVRSGLAPQDEFLNTATLTRQTYTLAGMTGTVAIGPDGKSIAIAEEDGLDYAAVTLQLPGGERVPFLFSVKNLRAVGGPAGFAGAFDVPSYRGATFMDPKGRGAATGWDNAVALPARADADEFAKENVKTTKGDRGTAVFTVSRVDPTTGEVAGLFESLQPSDTDLGAKAPKDVRVTGLWYAQLEKVGEGSV